MGPSPAPVSGREGHPPLLDGMQKLLEGSEGRAVPPDAQAAHVDHVPGLRGTWVGGAGKVRGLEHPGMTRMEARERGAGRLTARGAERVEADGRGSPERVWHLPGERSPASGPGAPKAPRGAPPPALRLPPHLWRWRRPPWPGAACSADPGPPCPSSWSWHSWLCDTRQTRSGAGRGQGLFWETGSPGDAGRMPQATPF